jgi:hypothetical protein
LLPTLSSSGIGCISDYSFGGPKCLFDTLSYLLFEIESLGEWIDLRAEIRRTILGTERTISYKALNNKVKREALLPCLSAANSINGLLVTFSVHHKVDEFNIIADKFTAVKSSLNADSRWKRKSFEKAVRAATLCSFAMTGLCNPSMRITWLTDNDEIADKPSKRHDLLRLFVASNTRFSKTPPTKVRIQTPLTTEISRDVAEDLLTIPDIAAGCLASVVNAKFHETGVPRLGSILEFPDFGDMAKQTPISGWLCRNEGSLKKVAVIVYPHEDGGVGKRIRIAPNYEFNSPYCELSRANDLGELYRSLRDD